MPASKVNQAGKLFTEFTGHLPSEVVEIQIEWPDTVLTVGECDGILYSTVRDGKQEHYIHRFKKSARPLLVASHDGAQIALIGGNYRFTDRGIVDQ